jgi:hypothetical protein
MTEMRRSILLTALAILAAVAQLAATQWGLIGGLAGGLLCGITVFIGMRLLNIETDHIFLPSLIAIAASTLGLALAFAGTGNAYPLAAWFAPLLAAMPSAVPAIAIALRGARCELCHARLRGLLSFSCPRCHLVSCENCWQFERGRCRLCETNQVALFPLDREWWQQHFGSQARAGKCALCLRTADWSVAHWACVGCGHTQCRLCWDDNNGQCSRCGWIIPGLPAELHEFVAFGRSSRKIASISTKGGARNA